MFKLKDAYQCSVLVAKPLDFESKSSYVLNISASNVSLLLLTLLFLSRGGGGGERFKIHGLVCVDMHTKFILIFFFII